MEEAKRDGATIEGSRAMISGGFTFHDVKAKGITDHKGHHSGHKSARMQGVYIRKPEQVEATK